ncbi:MAG TPA: hypothetical protein VFG01_08550, partial [Acidobacteriota bacterium]|nr:hypothetical protein [Acidobacteriota bacterium]
KKVVPSQTKDNIRMYDDKKETPSKVKPNKLKNNEKEQALKEPKVEEFINTFRARILSVNKGEKKN